MVDGKRLAPRPDDKRPRLMAVSDAELDRPKIKTVLKVIYNTLARLFHDPVGMVLGSTFVLLMLWGTHGKVDLLSLVWDGWTGPGSDPTARGQLIPGIPWDQEWLSFLIGAVLLVAIPVLLIKLVYRQDLKDYGLGLPPRGRRAFALLSAAILFVVSLPAFYLGTKDAGMHSIYPMYRGVFGGFGPFIVYELGYLLFFVVIEFTFRGYLLFGLYQFRDRDAPEGIVGVRGPLVFGYYAIFIAMLSYTAWHLGKPVPELWGTLVWGIAAGTVVLVSRSIWLIVVVHWLLNVFLDLAMWRGW
jgi:hypothetical protein